MFKCCYFLLPILLTVPFSTGHLGHDHGDHDSHGAHDESKDSEWKNSRNISLKHSTGVDLKWNDKDPERISMKMSSRTTGYVSVGFCAKWEGTMANCDIVIGWVVDGKPYLHDYHAKGNEAPIMDEKQDYELIRGTEVDGVTTIEFRRKWDTDDDSNDANLQINSVHIIYSWHPIDPKNATEIPPHDKNSRGHTAAAVNLKNPSIHYNDHHSHEHNHQTSAANSYIFQSVKFLLISLAMLQFNL